MRGPSHLYIVAGFAAAAQAQLASKCASILPNGTSVACVNKYAAAMPEPFHRTLANNASEIANDSFRLTSVPSDPSFDLVRDATFIVFNETAGKQILGSSPSYEYIFVSPPTDSIHEAPVYIPYLNSIIFSLPHQGIFTQRLVNLSTSPPTLQNYTTNPPIYAVNGGRYFDGSLYWAVEGGIPFPNPSNPSQTVLQSPGIARVNPNTSSSAFITNNYFGTPFNSPNDLVVSSKTGDIFFTDSWYGYAINVSSTYPPLAPATYRIRPSSGQVSVVENTLQQPNGIGFSPDESILYLTDTGITDFSNPPSDGSLPRYGLDRRGGHDVYAFDTLSTPAGYQLINGRPIWRAEEFADDGFHVTALQNPADRWSYFLIGASGGGVDVLSPWGELFVRITVTNFTVNNIQFAGPEKGQHRDLWLFGSGGVARVKWNVTGMLEE